VRIIIRTIEIIINTHIDQQVDQIIITIIEVETIVDQTETEVDQIGIITDQIGIITDHIGMITGRTGIIIIHTRIIMDIGIIRALQIHFDQIEINHVIIIEATIQMARQEIFAGAGITTDETKYHK
jgi:hypothetical protein